MGFGMFGQSGNQRHHLREDYARKGILSRLSFLSSRVYGGVFGVQLLLHYLVFPVNGCLFRVFSL